MPTASRYRCPCCGAALVFASQSQQLHCDSCGNDFPMEAIQAVAAAQYQNDLGDQMAWTPQENSGFSGEESGQLRAYRCEGCGAEILADADTAATSCVYCGSPSILPGVLSGAYRPDAVLPFRKSKEEAVQALRKHCQGKRLLPRGFLDGGILEKITGVYVPFWLYQAEAEADCAYNATRTHTHREGQYQVTRTEHYLLRRGGHMAFRQVPVNGSTKADDSMMESIEPFAAEQAQDFSVGYLSGYQAQRHDMDAAACEPRANERIRESVAAAMAATVHGYASVTPSHSRITLEHGKVRQVLLPVWMLNTRWKDKIYTFAMNGQTGRFIGDLPTDWGRFWGYLLGIALGIGLGGTGLIYLLLKMGVMG